MKKTAILFGAAGGGRRLLPKIVVNYDVKFFVDNDKKKWGDKVGKYEICSPSTLLQGVVYDYIIITSEPGKNSIFQQLLDVGVERSKIVTQYVESALEARDKFICNLADLWNENKNGACAEVGVFQGQFAQVINSVFKDKKLYLFDTFEGFDKRDIEIERSNKYSIAEINDYNFTSVEMVLSRMPYSKQCIIKKGYFPDSTEGIEEQFCFVNLDLDLYSPTLQGLRWFSKRMTEGGVILVHDYFTTNFKGVRHAVEDFLRESHKQYGIMPIGDGVSIAILGF